MAREEDQFLRNGKLFTVHLATPADFSKISQHIRKFFLRDEPMNKLLGWCDQNADDFDEIIKIVLEHRLSIFITEEGQENIAAVNLITDSRLLNFSALKINSFNAQNFMGICYQLEANTRKEFDAASPCGFHAEIFMTSVATKYRLQGLATEMYERTLNHLRLKGFQIVKVSFSSPGTRAVGKKLGLTEIGRIYFRDYENENGEKPYIQAGSDECLAKNFKIII